MSAAVVNTPFTMSFCLTASGAPVSAWIIPTYFAPPTSEAFLGNNGFYTGIPGRPAIYQTAAGSTTVTIKNIQVLDANGNPATGWELVSGDAESTDSGESITWTSCSAITTEPSFPNIGSGCVVADPVLSLLPNSPTSTIGNACAAPTANNYANVDLSGIGGQTVECAATVNSDKTGTVMIDAATPTSLTINMVGTGLEAFFIGLLLP